MRSWFAIMSPTTDAFLHRGAKPLLLGIHFHCSARWYREYRVQFESSRQLLSHDHTPGSYLLLIAICITNKYNISIPFYTHYNLRHGQCMKFARLSFSLASYTCAAVERWERDALFESLIYLIYMHRDDRWRFDTLHNYPRNGIYI